jgi:hypothetical protein
VDWAGATILHDRRTGQVWSSVAQYRSVKVGNISWTRSHPSLASLFTNTKTTKLLLIGSRVLPKLINNSQNLGNCMQSHLSALFSLSRLLIPSQRLTLGRVNLFIDKVL